MMKDIVKCRKLTAVSSLFECRESVKVNSGYVTFM